MSEYSEANYSEVTYPSDRLSVAQLRARGPYVFEEEWERLDSMLYLEQMCVDIGFKEALGERRSHMVFSGLTAHDIEGELTDIYVHLGLASGKQSAKQLIKEIKAAGAKQAKSCGAAMAQ